MFVAASSVLLRLFLNPLKGVRTIGMHSLDPHAPAYRWIVSQEGSRQSYAVPVAFHRLNLLRLFCVDTWCRWGRSVLKHGPKGLRAFGTHFVPDLPPELVVSFNTSFFASGSSSIKRIEP
jgi:hypothetical protein